MTVKLKNMKNSDSAEKPSQNSNSKTVTCYICEKRVKDYNLSSHLFFGSLECRECHFKFRYCRKYYSFRKSKDPNEIERCEHRKLRYTRDPVEYLERKLRKDPVRSRSKDIEASGGEVLRDMKLYLDVLKPIENRSPWRYAIEKLKKYVSRKYDTRHLGKTSSKKSGSTQHWGKEKHGDYTKVNDHPEVKNTCYITSKEVGLPVNENDNKNRDTGEVKVPQFLEETVISQTEWNVENVSVKDFEGCNQSITISLNIGEDGDVPLIVDTIYIYKHEEEHISLFVEDNVFTSHLPAAEVDSSVQADEDNLDFASEVDNERALFALETNADLEYHHKKALHESVVDDMGLFDENTDENDILGTKTVDKYKVLLTETIIGEETTKDINLNEMVADEAKVVHTLLLDEMEKQRSNNEIKEKVETNLTHGLKIHTDDAHLGSKQYYRHEEVTKIDGGRTNNLEEKNNNESDPKVKGLISRIPTKSIDALVAIDSIENEFGSVIWPEREVTSKDLVLDYKEQDTCDRLLNVSKSKRKFFLQKRGVVKGYLQHQKNDKRSYKVRDIAFRNRKESMSRGRKKYRKRECVQGNSIKIKKYNLRSRRHKPSEAFLQRLDAYEKKKLWEKLVPIAKMLRKLTAEGRLGCLPTLYLPIDSVEEDDDFLVDVLLSQVFDIQQLRKMLMYVPCEGNQDEITVIVDEVKKAIDQFSNLPDKLDSSSSVDEVKPVMCQFNESFIKDERVKGRTESITKSLDRIIFGKSVHKRKSKTYYVNPPADGKYYIVSYPSQPFIRECPMCYYRVFPAMFSLNLVTNLAVTQCVGCALTIYVVQESNDIDYLPKIVFKGEHTQDRETVLPRPARYKLFSTLRLQTHDSDGSI